MPTIASSTSRRLLATAVVGIVAVMATKAPAQSVEPDDFPAGTVLNTAVPGVTLSTTGGLTNGNVLSVTGTPLTGGTTTIASTGTRVFGRQTAFATSNTFANTALLIAAFDVPQDFVSIDFIGAGIGISNQVTSSGTLTAFDSGGNQLDQATFTNLAVGEILTLSLSVPGAISSITARGFAEQDVTISAGPVRLDNLIVIPEPATAGLLAGAGLLALRRRR